MSPPETLLAQPSRDTRGLNAAIGFNRRLALFRLENRDAFAWSHCQLSVNAHGISSGYTHELESIAPGIAQAALVPSAEFSGAGGSKLDPSTEAVTTLDVACETPKGPLSYAGTFTPRNP